jgi:hypothetical protein
VSEEPKVSQRARRKHPGDLTVWLAGRRNEVERWIEDACQRAVVAGRGALGEEIRTLSRRVERMHALLDQLEHIVDSPFSREDDDQSIGP